MFMIRFIGYLLVGNRGLMYCFHQKFESSRMNWKNLVELQTRKKYKLMKDSGKSQKHWTLNKIKKFERFTVHVINAEIMSTSGFFSFC
jgi:hypothetical protein